MNTRAASGFLALVVAAGSLAARADDWKEAEAIVASIHDPVVPTLRVNISALGALPDGRTDALPAIRRAIAQCEAKGGGHVVVPAGTFLVDGPIRLESNLDLHLEAGAVLLFGADPARYLPVVLSRYEGTLYYGHSARITARGATNVCITGSGTIDGNARGTFALMKGRPVGSVDLLRADGANQVPVKERVFGEGHWLRPSLIEPYDCTHVLIEGVTLEDSTFWIVHPILSRFITVRNLKVESFNANNDGCDPDSCSDILVEGCDFHTGDDSIAIKSGRDKDAWAVGRATERLVIRHCIMRSRYSALCIGSEMSGGVRDVFMEDCKVIGSASAFYFKGNLDRGGLVEHIRARNITVDAVKESAIRFETGYHGYRGGHFPPSFKDFVIENLTCGKSSAYALYSEGVEGCPIRQVLIRNVTVVSAKAALWLKHNEDLTLDHVSVNGVVLPPHPPETGPAEIKLPIKS